MDRRRFLATSTAGLVVGCSSSTGPSGPPTILTSALPDGSVGASYPGGLRAEGGRTPYTWGIVGGSLPTGLTLNTSTGSITGSPTTRGESKFTVRVADSNGQTAQQQFTIFVKQERLVLGLYDDFDGQGGFQERSGIHLAQAGSLSPDLWYDQRQVATVEPWDGSDGVDRGNVVKMATSFDEACLYLVNPKKENRNIGKIDFQDFQSWSADVMLPSDCPHDNYGIYLDYHTSIPEQPPAISWYAQISLKKDGNWPNVYFARQVVNKNEGGYREGEYLIDAELGRWYSLRMDIGVNQQNMIEIQFLIDDLLVDIFVVPSDDSQLLLNPTQGRFGPSRNFDIHGAAVSEPANAAKLGFIDNVKAVYTDTDLPPS